MAIRWHWGSKDGGKDSNSFIYGLEIKKLFSVLVVKFHGKSRNVFHDHAFSSWNWLISGYLTETHFDAHWTENTYSVSYAPSWKPIKVWRNTFHKVEGTFWNNWVLAIRGPWDVHWQEYNPETKEYTVLTHGRKEIS